MDLEPAFPFEYSVEGVPISHQSKGSGRREWQDLLRSRFRRALPEGHFATAQPLFVTILYFPDGEMIGDVDNIVKPILDAMCPEIYLDDKQVERVIVQKFEPTRDVSFRVVSDTLAEAVGRARPVLYVRLDTAATAPEIW